MGVCVCVCMCVCVNLLLTLTSRAVGHGASADRARCLAAVHVFAATRRLSLAAFFDHSTAQLHSNQRRNAKY